jgi:hypothetical protein
MPLCSPFNTSLSRTTTSTPPRPLFGGINAHDDHEVIKKRGRSHCDRVRIDRRVTVMGTVGTNLSSTFNSIATKL